MELLYKPITIKINRFGIDLNRSNSEYSSREMTIDQLTQQIDQKKRVRREIDLQKEIALILDAVKKFGPRNISLIARQTGIPRETVRVRLSAISFCRSISLLTFLF